MNKVYNDTDLKFHKFSFSSTTLEPSPYDWRCSGFRDVQCICTCEYINLMNYFTSRATWSIGRSPIAIVIAYITMLHPPDCSLVGFPMGQFAFKCSTDPHSLQPPPACIMLLERHTITAIIGGFSPLCYLWGRGLVGYQDMSVRGGPSHHR